MSEGAAPQSRRGSEIAQIPAFKRKIPEYTGENQFNSLPDEATLYIFSFLDARDLCHLSQVSKGFAGFANDELMWKETTMFDWGINTPFASTWKESYALLEDLCEDGIWEGMSKWMEPAGFDNEQKTTARLHFVKRSRTPTAQITSVKSSPTTIHRVDSQTSTTPVVKSSSADAKSSDRDAPYKIIGSGVTINCATPSPFKIEGSRTIEDPTGCTFEWNKQFEKHTSVYSGQMDYASRSVCGTINYNDGTTHWKGIFSYTKLHNRGTTKLVMA